jgi:hypothetical protein
MAILTPQTLGTAVEELADGLARMGDLDVSALGADEQARLLRALARAESRLAGVRLRLLAAADRAHTAQRSGASSTGHWAASLTRADAATAHREVGLARSLELLRTTRSALADGDVSPAHAAVISHALDRLPTGVTPGQRDQVETSLVAKAKELSPQTLRRVARRCVEAIEPDPAVVDAHEDALVYDEEAGARERTRLTFHDNHDGTVTGHFTVPVLQGHLLRKVIETMTAPRRGRLGSSVAQAGPTQGPRTDWDHARGLALCELLEHLPTDHLHPRTAATLVVTVRDDVLRGSLAAAGLDTGESISSGEARRLACGAGLLPAVLGGRSVPLDLGRSRRLFSDHQRVGLGLTHTTCAADGCERPFAWCELHHRRPWAGLGPSDLANAVPLCHFHHQRIHDAGFLHAHLPDGSIRFRRRT